MKSFEIEKLDAGNNDEVLWTKNLKSFEIYPTPYLIVFVYKWTKNLKSFEIHQIKLDYFHFLEWTKNLKSFEMPKS